MSLQYFHSYSGVNSLQVKVKYNKVIMALWKYYSILCVSRNWFLLVNFCWTKIHYFTYSFLGWFFCILFLYAPFYIKAHSFTHTHTHTHTQKQNKNLGLKHFSSFMFWIIHNSSLNLNENLWFLKYFIVYCLKYSH